MSEGGDLLSQEEIDALLREVEAAAAEAEAAGTGAPAPGEVDDPVPEDAGETAKVIRDDTGVATESVIYPELDDTSGIGPKASIELLHDVPMEITVVLGQARLRVREVLDIGPGSIIELDRLAGEPVDVMVNGRLIAKGEVVVIDEHFGIRINEIVGRRGAEA